MNCKIPYSPPYERKSSSFFFSLVTICSFLLLFVTQPALADGGEFDYDEIPVFVTVPGVGSVEIQAIVTDETIYLSVTNLFDFLKIRNDISPGQDSITGFMINPQATYLIDKKHSRIVYGEKIFNLRKNDIVRSETNLYLRSDYFGKVFGLECVFNFRSLSVILNTKLELPVIREMRQEAMRNNIRQLNGQVKVDTNILRRYPVFHFGMADWSVITTQTIKGPDDTRLNLSLGTILAGGETNISLNYDNLAPLSEKQQYYLWHYVNNDHAALRQVMAGKIFTQSASSIYFPVVGVQFTNASTTYRRSFGTYTLSDHTEPNWMVELYVNGVLVNYAKADASGFYTFEVPLVYGNSLIKLRFYGPWGEERTTEQFVDIPFNFLPKGQFEYTVSAGVVEDSLHSRFARASFNYGLGKHVTVGGGMEQLSSVTTGRYMPFANVSLRLVSNLLISSEYIYGVRLKNVISYRLPSNLQFDITYNRYKNGQQAINNTFLEERKVVLTFPFHDQKFSLFSRFSVYQIILPIYKNLPSSKLTTAEALFSGIFFGVNSNLTTYAVFNTSVQPYWYSNLSSTFRLPGKLIFTPQLQYEYNQNKVIDLKAELGRSMSFHGYASVYYENNIKSGIQSVGIALRYDFSFAQLSFSARHGDHVSTLVESARGSLMYNHEIHYFGSNNRTSVGRGGLAIIPYLDLNGNGKRDPNEPKVFGLRIQVSAGLVKYITADTTTLVSDLESYTSYVVKLNTEGFENISWQVHNKVLKVTIDPNQFKLIEIPVVIMGEVSGTVYLETDKDQKGLGRVLVNFYRSDSSFAGQTLTEADGSFNFAGLLQGSYKVSVDSAQLGKLYMTSLPGSLDFTISASREGDVVEGLKFVLKNLPAPVPINPQ